MTNGRATGGRFYMTAAIDYVNGSPHLGHAYEKVAVDMIARHQRLRGLDVRVTLGSDEHSQSVLRTARDQGLTPRAWCDQQEQLWRGTWERFDIVPTDYVRTADEPNRRSTDAIMQRLHDRGHLYMGRYTAWFCPSCERFYTEKELVDERCPVHAITVEWVEEENWFFRLSAFTEPLLRHFDDHPDFLTPAPRRNEILNVIRGGLEDISVSRAFSDWGFPLPFDSGQVVYVWFDALLAYLTGIGFQSDAHEFDSFWPADVHVIGKDITRFHCVMWPAMLMAAGLPLPRRVHAHGWMLLGGQKMSKTKGVFIDPVSLVDAHGSDAVRYVLLSEVPFDRDGDFSMEVFVDRYNADLANDYGNLVSRTEKMVARYRDGVVPTDGVAGPLEEELAATASGAVSDAHAAMDDLNLSEAINAARRLVAAANRYVDQTRPWDLAKAPDDVRLGAVLRALLEAVRVSSILLWPVIPRAAGSVLADLGLDDAVAAAGDVARWDVLRPGAEVRVGDILFPRLDRAAVLGAVPAE